MTAVTEKSEALVAIELEKANRRNRILLTSLIALAFIAAGLGTWLTVGLVGQADSGVTVEIETLLDDYLATWNTYDGDAFLELVTEDYLHEARFSSAGAMSQAVTIDGLGVYEWSVEPMGELIVIGSDPWYVYQANHLESTRFGPDGLDGLSAFTIVEEGETMKISHHEFIDLS